MRAKATYRASLTIASHILSGHEDTTYHWRIVEISTGTRIGDMRNYASRSAALRSAMGWAEAHNINIVESELPPRRARKAANHKPLDDRSDRVFQLTMPPPPPAEDIEQPAQKPTARTWWKLW